jgi:heptosyltransferase-2
LIRVPNHLGDLVMSLPAIAAAPHAHLLVPRAFATLLEPLISPDRIIAFDRGFTGFRRATSALRARRHARGILLPASFSSALQMVAGGVPARRGLATDSRRALLTDAVPLAAAKGLHRTAVYHLLVTGEMPQGPLVPRLPVSEEQQRRWRLLTGARPQRLIGVFPGSNATSRRWDAERFRELVRRLAAEGNRVVVFGGVAETTLTRYVAAESAFDAGGRTDLPLLAAALAGCDILVTNDSGPLHLAAAVGTATVSLWGAGNPAITGPPDETHRMLRRADLPCVPCVKNTCPRSGPGFVLPNAERECLRLIEVSEVLAAVVQPTRAK